ncbi:MAG: hypothetical protein CM15mV2_0620 [uncultured marine virus]|nr:MAG: hypothetical protein CM15mV2_0620 [uncultured marine virus]
MDLQKIATYSSAAAVVGTGAIVGGGQVIDNINDDLRRDKKHKLNK